MDINSSVKLIIKHFYESTFFRERQGVNFGENVETQISGSGDGRWNYKAMREADEIKNQRFLIHSIPKNIFNDEASTN